MPPSSLKAPDYIWPPPPPVYLNRYKGYSDYIVSSLFYYYLSYHPL